LIMRLVYWICMPKISEIFARNQRCGRAIHLNSEC